jgi:hypothetical protein
MNSFSSCSPSGRRYFKTRNQVRYVKELGYACVNFNAMARLPSSIEVAILGGNRSRFQVEWKPARKQKSRRKSLITAIYNTA